MSFFPSVFPLVFNNFLVVNGDEIGLEKINEGG
jgi:hypothetical protein